MTRESHELLWEIKARLAAIERQLGLIAEQNPQPHDTKPPAIPLEVWHLEPYLDTIYKLMCGEDKLAEVYHRETTPQLGTMLAMTPQTYLALRELVLLFQCPTKALGEVWACFWYNGHPVAPHMVREYLTACAVLTKASPKTPLPVAEPPPPDMWDMTAGLGPVELQSSNPKGKERCIRLFQYPDGRYTVTAEQQPLDPETGEPLLKIGRIELEYGTRARGAPDEDTRNYFR